MGDRTWKLYIAVGVAAWAAYFLAPGLHGSGLPVDVLKIDRAFTARITDDPKESALARAILGLGPTLGLMTVAEGVETPEQWRRLSALGCDFGQGFLLSRPVDDARLEALLHRAAHNPAGPADGASCAF